MAYVLPGEIYIEVLVSAITGLSVVAAAFPSAPSPSSPSLMALAVIVLLRLAGYLVIAVATFLLGTQERIWVKRLRFAIGVALFLDGVSLALDQLYFPHTFVANLGRWSVLFAWLVYFFVSVRVQMVFYSKERGKVSVREILQ